MKRKGWIPGFAAYLPAILLASHSHAQAPILSDAGQQVIEEYLGQVVRDTHIPGLVALVTNQDGVIYAGAFGRQDVAQARPMSVDSIFRIASMTKPITSAAVMMLIEDGELGLDDPVSMYLPGHLPEEVFETFNPDDNSFTSRPLNGEVTVRHLLTHTSGLGYNIFSEILFPLLRSQSPPPSALGHPSSTLWPNSPIPREPSAFWCAATATCSPPPRITLASCG